MGPFDRFNDRAKRVLALAQDEAIRFDHNYIGAEHLILGLVREGEGVAARVLDAFGIELSALRRAVKFKIGRGENTTPPTEIILAPVTKKIIELAIDEARKLGHSHVGTEHLLLGIVREGENTAAAMLRELGIDLEKVRHEVVATLGRPHVAGTTRRIGPTAADMFHDAQGRKRDWYCEDILSGTLKVKVLWEDERVLALEHPFPTSPVHALVIPKKHVASLIAPDALDPDLLLSMLRGVQHAAFALGLEREGFQLVANAAAPDVTPHLHWHLHGPGIPPGGGSWQFRAARPVPGDWTSTPYGKVLGPAPDFDRFAASAKRVLTLAIEEAVRLQHNYIGTEHLLLGVVREETTARLLAEAGVEVSRARTALEFIIGRGDTRTAPGDITMSPRAKKVLELASDEARRLGKTSVVASDVLLGLIREGQGIASGILESLKIDVQALKARAEKEPPPAA